ncbi:unnamed protein product [Arabis nemorensis]|uniref:DUF1216 domain-containing protein n=1 Tax=Arabis nemorensis TaxID=586526 RepID=A0A565AVF3_9BRAS|nr:unnamed protein product [Arabis nemorensis]
MARIQLFLCFTILFASATLLDVVSAHLKIKAALPQIEDPKTVNDVEPYTVKVVMVFVTDLEKECPKTSKFKAFFEKLRAYAKYVCPIKRSNQKEDYDLDMKAKAGSLFQTIASFAIGKIREEIQEEKMEAIETFKKMKSLAGRIMGSRKKDENEESMKLTAEQQKEIKEGILKWETVITQIANTMVQSTTNSSSVENSTSGKEISSGTNKNSGSGSSFKDTTGSSSDLGSPSGSPSSSKSGSSSVVEGESGTSFKDTTGGNSISPSGSPTTSSANGSGGSSISPTASSTSSTTSESLGASQNSALPVTEVEAETSKDVMTFIMNLEKKCPQKEEYKSFFEKLKGTMTASATASSKARQGFFAGIKSVGGKLFDAMAFMRSRIGSKSAKVKSSMETYQTEVMKTVQELDTIYSQIVSQNKGKKDGSLTCTPEQQKQIKLTITKWEQVTTQFVETAIQTESSSTSSSP